MSDWSGCCFLPLLAGVKIIIDDEPETSTLWENKIAVSSSIISPPRPSQNTSILPGNLAVLQIFFEGVV